MFGSEGDHLEMLFPREVLNKIKWTGNPDLHGVRIHILHRGAPHDTKIVEGKDVVDLEHSYLVITSRGQETHIPYHRVQRIFHDGDKVYDRQRFQAGERE